MGEQVEFNFYMAQDKAYFLNQKVLFPYFTTKRYVVGTSKDKSSQKHASIILAPLNPTFIR